MRRIFKKYNLLFLLAFVMLVMVSCQKGGEPVPFDDGVNITSNDDGSNLRTGDDDGDGNEGDEDDGTIIGGDDNEDDDDSDAPIVGEGTNPFGGGGKSPGGIVGPGGG